MAFSAFSKDVRVATEPLSCALRVPASILQSAHLSRLAACPTENFFHWHSRTLKGGFGRGNHIKKRQRQFHEALTVLGMRAIV